MLYKGGACPSLHGTLFAKTVISFDNDVHGVSTLQSGVMMGQSSDKEGPRQSPSKDSGPTPPARASSETGRGLTIAMLLANPLAPDVRVEKEATFVASQGHRVVVYAWDRDRTHPRHEERKGFTIERIGVRSTYGLGLLQVPALLVYGLISIWRLRGLKPDIVHCHDLETLPVGLLAGRRIGCRVVFDAHEPVFFADTNFLRNPSIRIASRLERLLAPRADAVIVAQQDQVSKYAGEFNVPAVQLLPNYPPSELIEHWIEPPVRENPVVGRLGSMHVDDGVELLIEAFSRLQARYPGLRLKLAGSTSVPQVLAPKLASMKRAGPGLEYIPSYNHGDLPILYSEIDVAVMPYDPTSPNCQLVTLTKAFEALACGVPIVVSDVGRIGSIVRREGCGIVLDTVTVQSIADAIDELLRDEKRRRQMGRKGRQAVIERYNWASAVDAVLIAYERALNTGHNVQ